MNILIAEDEKDIRNILKLHLELEGYLVFPAKDGVEALEVIQSKLNSSDTDKIMTYNQGVERCQNLQSER